MLQAREMCVCEITAALGLAQPTVSKHLRILEEAGLVRSRKSGQWVNYGPADGTASPYAAALLDNLRGWIGDDPDMRMLLDGIHTFRREDIVAGRTETAVTSP